MFLPPWNLSLLIQHFSSRSDPAHFPVVSLPLLSTKEARSEGVRVWGRPGNHSKTHLETPQTELQMELLWECTSLASTKKWGFVLFCFVFNFFWDYNYNKKYFSLGSHICLPTLLQMHCLVFSLIVIYTHAYMFQTITCSVCILFLVHMLSGLADCYWSTNWWAEFGPRHCVNGCGGKCLQSYHSGLESGGSEEVQWHPWLHRELKASVSFKPKQIETKCQGTASEISVFLKLHSVSFVHPEM